MRLSSLLVLVSILWAGPALGQIVGVLEGPDEFASQVSNVQGWVYTKTPGAELVQPFQVVIGGELAFEVPCCSDRGDVQLAYPDAPLRTGFSGVWNWGLTATAADAPAEVDGLQSSSVDVEVIVKDTAGGQKTLRKTVTVRRLSEEVPFFREADWPPPDDAKRAWCTAIDSGDLSSGTAGIECHNMVLTRGEEVRECDRVRYAWDRASQGFKQTSDCETLSRWTDNEDGTATDNWTGLQWELKNSDDEIPDAENPHDVDNLYSLEIGFGPLTVGMFLGSLNASRSDFEGAPVEPCFAGRCDWRLPTVWELAAIADPSAEGCGHPPFGPCTLIPRETARAHYWSATGTEPVTFSLWTVDFGTASWATKNLESNLRARAVRGTRRPVSPVTPLGHRP